MDLKTSLVAIADRLKTERWLDFIERNRQDLYVSDVCDDGVRVSAYTETDGEGGSVVFIRLSEDTQSRMTEHDD